MYGGAGPCVLQRLRVSACVAQFAKMIARRRCARKRSTLSSGGKAGQRVAVDLDAESRTVGHAHDAAGVLDRTRID